MGADVYRRGYGELSVYVAAGQTGQAGEVNNGRESAMQYREPERPLEPKDYKVPRCPVCGEETDTLYKNIYEEIVGCDGCIRTVDAWEKKE
jgi:hypothetical protein